MGASGRFKELFNAYFIHWQNKRVEEKINLRILFNESVRKQKREKDLLLAKIRYLPNTNITPSTTIIYSDKVATIMWSETPMAFLMRSKTVALSHTQFFNML